MFCDNLVNYYSDDFNYILAKEYEKYIEKSVFLEIFFKKLAAFGNFIVLLPTNNVCNHYLCKQDFNIARTIYLL